MAQAISVEIYQFLEEKVGKEEAKKVASAIEIGLEVIEKRADAVALQKKLELKDELTKELATKADLLILKEEFWGEMKSLRQEMQTVKVELEGKIEKLNQKFNFMIILMIIALTLMNPVMAEIIKNLLKL
ncbi:MAG: hypothetical protein Q8K51_05000 [Nitrospirota bacterium]|jgi:hypothetical protein|nr:hypothetical protein [Nitrospirota bacterium]